MLTFGILVWEVNAQKVQDPAQQGLVVGLKGLFSGCSRGQNISKTCKAVSGRSTEMIILSLGAFLRNCL